VSRSSATIAFNSLTPASPWAATMPSSARCARKALMIWVRAGFPLERLIALGHVPSHETLAVVRTLTWNVMPAAYDRLKAQGLQPQLAALGYERDLQQVQASGDRCPAISP
jgi:hypothetical protein